MKWISVKNKLPDNENDVLVVNNDGWMMVSCCFTVDGKKIHWERRNDLVYFGDVTHWMPLPEKPYLN